MDQAKALGMVPGVIDHITVVPIYAQTRANAPFSWSVAGIVLAFILGAAFKIAGR